ncbi:MAG: hypothetical protein F6K42_17690 [Leptolyngbya sp. SIO1D8]|nr:hypothetical protein [Leptolyngbya sp. SIO1D8]
MRINQPFLLAIAGLVIPYAQAATALPPPEDIPEEVLRTEIILEARSPLTGEPMTAAEYEQLQETFGRNEDPLLPSQIRELVFLLQLRRVVEPFIPFLP